MIIDGEKWACEACVRGHRVSNCQHSGMSLVYPHRLTQMPASLKVQRRCSFRGSFAASEASHSGPLFPSAECGRFADADATLVLTSRLNLQTVLFNTSTRRADRCLNASTAEPCASRARHM
jgi:hypothetical protein